MNLAETSFVLAPPRSDVRARYFTLADDIETVKVAGDAITVLSGELTI